MTNMEDVRKYFEEELRRLEVIIEKEKLARDNAPSAMESASDTIRNQKERLIFALEDRFENLKNLVNSIPDEFGTGHNLWSKHHFDKLNCKVLIVPEGLGGIKVGGLFLVSINSPLIKHIL